MRKPSRHELIQCAVLVMLAVVLCVLHMNRLRQERLSRLWQTGCDAMSDHRIVQANDCWRQIVEQEPDNADAWLLWGASQLIESAQSDRPGDADQLYRESCQSYETALSLDPQRQAGWVRWGDGLLSHGITAPTGRAEKALARACESYSRAIDLDPDDYTTWNKWGCALSLRAIRDPQAGADELFDHAYEKFRRATELKLDAPEVFRSWGYTLMAQSTMKQGDQRESLVQRAEVKLLLADRIQQGT